MSYKIVEITPDTPEWEQERRNSIGASEAAAVLGLSKWQTPLSVYNSKMGAPNNFDPELSYVTHASEAVVHGWIEEFHPEWGTLEPGFMGRSTTAPYLHASFDRILVEPDGTRIPLQIKTGHQNAKASWDNGVPTEYQVQEQVEMFVLGAQRARLVVMHGGRSFAWYDIPRDDVFIEEFLLPSVMEFWADNVFAQIPPEPLTTAEATELWPGNPELSIEGEEPLFELWGAFGLLQAEKVAIDEQLEEIKLQLQKAMQEATELTYQGQTLFTWKPRKGSTRFDDKRFKADHPDMAATYIKEGEPTRTFIRKTVKEVTA
jgi:putative phage-type endonuclease